MATRYTDNFPYANGALPSTWQGLDHSGGSGFPQVLSGEVIANSSAGYNAAYYKLSNLLPEPLCPDQWAQLTKTNNFSFCGPGVRMSGNSAATSTWACYFNHGSLQTSFNGGISSIGSPTVFLITDVARIEVRGLNYSLFINGSQVGGPGATFPDASSFPPTTGSFGVVFYGNQATVDTFSGGDHITTVLHSVGATGRDYSTIQAWHDAAPSNLITGDTIWKGECYNDSEFQSGSGNVGNFSVTADEYHYLHLTVAAGHSFQDHASVRTNPLKYDQSKGVGIRSHTTYAGYGISTTSQWTRLERLQIRAETQGTPVTGGGTVRMKDCLLVSQYRNCVEQVGSGSMFFNVSCFMENAYVGTSTGCLSGFYGAPLLENCTLVRQFSSGVTGTAVRFSGSTTLKSCAIFGFSTIVFNGDAASSNNATDAASGLPGSSNQHSVTFSAITPFVGANASGNDLRAVAGTTLAANGLLDSIYAPNDISNTARANPPTIGAWEILAAAAANADFVKALRRPFMFKPGSPRR